MTFNIQEFLKVPSFSIRTTGRKPFYRYYLPEVPYFYYSEIKVPAYLCQRTHLFRNLNRSYFYVRIQIILYPQFSRFNPSYLEISFFLLWTLFSWMRIHIIAERTAKFLDLRSRLFPFFPYIPYNLSKFTIVLGIKVVFFISQGQEFTEKSS